LNQGHARRYPQTSGGANKEKSAKFSLQLDELIDGSYCTFLLDFAQFVFQNEN
jgi:hypothetical protein